MTKEKMIERIYEVIGTDNLRYVGEGMFDKDVDEALMIGDILDYKEKNKINMIYDTQTIEEEICHLREHKRLPIDDQSEECITFIYNINQ